VLERKVSGKEGTSCRLLFVFVDARPPLASKTRFHENNKKASLPLNWRRKEGGPKERLARMGREREEEKRRRGSGERFSREEWSARISSTVLASSGESAGSPSQTSNDLFDRFLPRSTSSRLQERVKERTQASRNSCSSLIPSHSSSTSCVAGDPSKVMREGEGREREMRREGELVGPR
jgi:hypothetical protein